jgi:hypothetical protein
VVTYKYGGSDARFNRLGGMALLFWNAIREAKSEGAEAMDLGRSDRDQAGLIAFKEHWGAAPSRLTYWRYAPAARVAGREGRTMHVARKLCGRLPGSVLTLAGRLLYRHIA